ncbi:CCN family member 5 [Gouania willdenowi]|uniref:Connective tissue growth factor n=1 Tax=Gouania willdenowi TaxID=441366 RepID=A0A8C5EVY4_GOUWI|nr:WNT1-inducible-signaling pathway protein 2 [Gouania willdenowi]
MERLLWECVIGLVVLLSVATQMLCQLCDKPCRCLQPSPRCPPGVPLVLDVCQCCKVCARQRGDACTDMLPCDSLKGLQCDYSASFPGEPGECVGQEDVGCQVNGNTYHEGQSFQPSCDTHCRCKGGGVYCVPTCPMDVRLPTPDCPNPQHVRLPGKCCKEWVCENLDNTVIQDAITATRPDIRWSARSRNPPLKKALPVTPTCTEQSTKWSACSQSCGDGLSTRVSNQNPACKLQMETRLCKVRPCQDVQMFYRNPEWRHHGRCKASYSPPGPIRLVHHGCYSTGTYRLLYCGQCTDSRCCTPYQTSTVEVTFQCATGRLLRRPVMMIQSCVCHNNCPYAPYTNPALRGLRP